MQSPVEPKKSSPICAKKLTNINLQELSLIKNRNGRGQHGGTVDRGAASQQVGRPR